MGTRPLRYHHQTDGEPTISVTTDPSFAAALGPWRHHRDRFATALHALAPSDWTRPTRCDAWSVREVVGHLTAVDQFWAFTLGNARDGGPPTRLLEGFDPSSSTNDLVAATLSSSIPELLERFTTGADAVAAILDSFTADAWAARCESPQGHVPTTCNLGHMYWDSWLHERDIFEPMGLAPASAADEVLPIIAFTFCFAGLQGGLVADPNPVGPGPDAPIDVVVGFDELTPSLRIRIDDAVAVTTDERSAGVAAGSAVTLADAFAGRAPLGPAVAPLPEALAAQLGRAASVL